MRRFVLALAVLAASGCGRREAAPAIAGARVGVDAVPSVSVFENHSGSLLAWRRAGVQARVLVHVDGHSDFDWFPDATIARLRAADAEAMGRAELPPYTLDGTTHDRFGIWNFVYPAAKLGIVKEFVWVVPDGTLSTEAAAADLVRGLVVEKIQKLSLDEVRALRYEPGRIRGSLVGVPTTICELASLPEFREPVLLDVDLDFLTTASAATQEVTSRPSMTPDELVARLRAKGIATDLATVSMSTMGGYLPPACRWVGPAMRQALERGGAPPDPRWTARAAAAREAETDAPPAAAARWREQAARTPEDGSAWYALSRAAEAAGDAAGAKDALARAVAADPLLAHATLFEADRQWLDGRPAEALALYERYLRESPASPYRAYALRRRAGGLARAGRADEAIAAFREVLALAPDHGDSHLDLGLLLRERGDLDGAIRELQAARRILPGLATYAMALGTTLGMAGRNDDAIAALEEAVALRPAWARAQTNLGLMLVRVGRPVHAVGPLKIAVELDPRDPRAAGALAELRRQGIASAGP